MDNSTESLGMGSKFGGAQAHAIKEGVIHLTCRDGHRSLGPDSRPWL